MKKSLIAGLILLSYSVLNAGILLATEVKSLRESDALDAPSDPVDVKKNVNDNGPIQRSYVQQPPLIPHKIKGYQINIKFNKCLTCHSWANYQKSGATKISQTHFAGRDGEVLSNVAPRRYFCNQCHVPQADAKPLVQNDFEPVQSLN